VPGERDNPTAGARDDGSTRLAAAALAVLYVALYVLPLGIRPLASPDEVRYAEIAREMLASGDWVSPHLNGVRYFEKPALGYWLDAASLAALGHTAFAIRLPAALATGLTALILFGLGRRYLSRSSAALAVGIFLTTFMVAGLGTFALLDSFLALFLTAALAAYYVAIETSRSRVRWLGLALCGAACAAAFLVKGFLALAIPVFVAAPYLAARRDWRTLLVSPWLPIAVAGVLIAPWAVLIQRAEPDFWRYFFWVEHVQRFAGEHSQHEQPFWYYAAYLPLIAWPWIAFAPAAVIGLRRTADDRRFIGFLVSWTLMPFLLFSLSKGKLPTYLLPCLAPLSLLLAAGLERYSHSESQRTFRVAAAVLAAVLLALLGVALVAQGRAEPVYSPQEWPRLATLVLCLGAGFAGTAFAVRARPGAARLSAVGCAGLALIVPLQTALPDRARENVAPTLSVAAYGDVPRDTRVVSDAPLFGTVAWTLGRDDVYVVSPGEIDYGLGYADARGRRLDGDGLERLIAASRGRHAVLVICEADTAAKLAPELPADASRREIGKVVFVAVPPQ
jgi:4-amino-4-deoxy-L-arabinose transferase